MKTISFPLAIFFAFLVISCSSPTGEAIDLRTGKKIQVVKDEEMGYMVNAETKKPVYLYVTVADEDTFYGRTGRNVNNKIVRTKSGRYTYTDDDGFVYRNGKYIAKTESGNLQSSDEDDGDETENGSTGSSETVEKYKVQSDGDVKIKNGDYKAKYEEDGDIKIKDGDKKIKIDDGKVKVKED